MPSINNSSSDDNTSNINNSFNDDNSFDDDNTSNINNARPVSLESEYSFIIGRYLERKKRYYGIRWSPDEVNI